MLINDTIIIETNTKDTLYFEKTVKEIEEDNEFDSEDALLEMIRRYSNIRDRPLFNRQREVFGPTFDFKESIGIGFTMHSQYLYGLPERAERLLLQSTEHSMPYRLYNLDVF